jgi:large subunit ribosomal protein L10
MAGEVKEKFDKAISAVLVDFRGVDVETITDLRTRFRAAGVEYKVVKNNVVRKALAGTDLGGNEDLAAQLKGMTAIAWTYEDPSSAAKIIRDFRKEGPEAEKLVVKCGVLEGEVLAADRVEGELASLPGKDEIRAMLLAQMMAPASSLVRQLNAPGQNLALVLDAFRRKQEEGA